MLLSVGIAKSAIAACSGRGAAGAHQLRSVEPNVVVRVGALHDDVVKIGIVFCVPCNDPIAIFLPNAVLTVSWCASSAVILLITSLQVDIVFVFEVIDGIGLATEDVTTVLFIEVEIVDTS